MKRKLKRRTAKGMTLMEIIIAIAIVAVMSTIMVATSQAINSYVKSARQTSNRVAHQAPIAEAGYVNAAGKTISEEIEIKVKPAEGEITLKGKAYAVYSDSEMTAHEEEFSRGHNMKFIMKLETVEVT